MNKFTIEECVSIVKTHHKFRECFAEIRRKHGNQFGVSKSASAEDNGQV